MSIGDGAGGRQEWPGRLFCGVPALRPLEEWPVDSSLSTGTPQDGMNLTECLVDSKSSTSAPSMNSFEQRRFSCFVSEKMKSLSALVICIVVVLTSLARVGGEGGVTRKEYGGSKPMKLSILY